MHHLYWEAQDWWYLVIVLLQFRQILLEMKSVKSHCSEDFETEGNGVSSAGPNA